MMVIYHLFIVQLVSRNFDIFEKGVDANNTNARFDVDVSILSWSQFIHLLVKVKEDVYHSMQYIE